MSPWLTFHSTLILILKGEFGPNFVHVTSAWLMWQVRKNMLVWIVILHVRAFFIAIVPCQDWAVNSLVCEMSLCTELNSDNALYALTFLDE